MIFAPPRFPGLPLGLATLALLVYADLYLFTTATSTPPSPLTLVFIILLLLSLPLLAWLGYRCLALARARYVVGRNALVIEWGGRREVIPLDSIGEVRLGAELAERLRPRGLGWPGYVAGSMESASLGGIEFLAATPQPGLVLVQYPAGWLALSPTDPEAFLTALNARTAEGMEEPVAPESLRPDLPQWPLWRDRLALALILLSGLSVLALIGYLTLIYPQLPAQIALHFDAHGQPDRFGPPTGLFLLPVIAGVAWALNTLGGVWLHRNETERAGAYLIFGATAFVQGLVWVATVGLLTAGRA